MLASGVGGGNVHSHIDSDRVIGDAGRRAKSDIAAQKVPVGRRYDKHRYSRWGGDSTVAYEQEGDAPRHLTVRGYLAEQRGAGEIASVGQADFSARRGWKVGRQSPAICIENEVRGYRRANVGARVGGRGPDRRNALRVNGAACGVRGLWSAIQNINAILSGERSHANQQ